MHPKSVVVAALAVFVVACNPGEPAADGGAKDAGVAGSGGGTAGSGGVAGAGGTAGSGGAAGGGGSAGAGGAAGTGGSDAGSDAGTDAGRVDGGADAGLDAGADAGPLDAAVPPEVDRFEVTQGEYLAFLVAAPPLSAQPPECSFNTSFTPQSTKWNPNTRPNHPVVGIDWCDAEAYCRFHGRRLCGRIDGGVTPLAEQNNFLVDQWYAACSSGGRFAYPYGPTYQPGACHDDVTDGGDAVPVGTKPLCRPPLDAGFADVFDLSGNAYEFTAVCDRQGDGGAGDFCSVRGGSHTNAATDGQLRCDVVGGVCRSCYQDVIGFRCCR